MISNYFFCFFIWSKKKYVYICRQLKCPPLAQRWTFLFCAVSIFLAAVRSIKVLIQPYFSCIPAHIALSHFRFSPLHAILFPYSPIVFDNRQTVAVCLRLFERAQIDACGHLRGVPHAGAYHRNRHMQTVCLRCPCVARTIRRQPSVDAGKLGQPAQIAVIPPQCRIIVLMAFASADQREHHFASPAMVAANNLRHLPAYLHRYLLSRLAARIAYSTSIHVGHAQMRHIHKRHAVGKEREEENVACHGKSRTARQVKRQQPFQPALVQRPLAGSIDSCIYFRKRFLVNTQPFRYRFIICSTQRTHICGA